MISHINETIVSRINWITSKNDMNNRLLYNIEEIKLQKEAENFHHLVIKDEVIKRKNNLIVSFNCVACGRENIIALNNLISKINRNIQTCPSCLNTSTSTIADKILQDKKAFEEQDELIQKKYMTKIMKTEDYKRLSSSVVSFQNEKFKNMHDMIYIPYFRTSQNIMSFENVFYDRSRDVIEKAINFQCRCNHCEVVFNCKNLHTYRSKPTILCKSCEIIFSLKKTQKETDISFRTKFQHKFIKYCNNKKIILQNGPIISFKKSDGTHTTSSIAFYLPDLKTLVDVYGNKEYTDNNSTLLIAIHEYALINNLTYNIINPKNYVKITRNYALTCDRLVKGKQHMVPAR